MKRGLDHCDTPGRSKRVPGSAEFPSLEYHPTAEPKEPYQPSMISSSSSSTFTNNVTEQVNGSTVQYQVPSAAIAIPQSPMRSTQQRSSSSCPSTPRSAVSKQDRFIPNRTTLDVEHNYYLLTKDENEAIDPESGKPLSLLLTPSQRKFNEELNNSLLKSAEGGSNHGGNRKRLIECRTSLTPSFDRASSSSSIAEHIQVCATIGCCVVHFLNAYGSLIEDEGIKSKHT
jgi:hypothetical protein